jgi:protein YIPF6
MNDRALICKLFCSTPLLILFGSRTTLSITQNNDLLVAQACCNVVSYSFFFFISIGGYTKGSFIIMEAPPTWATQAPPPSITTVQEHEQQLFSKYSTLDEPVLETILRDVRAVHEKLKVVMMPLDYSTQLLNYSTYHRVATEYDTTVATTTTTSAPLPSNTITTLELSDHDKSVIRKLKDWDLWGPLVLCLALAVILSFKAPTNQAAIVFAAVFCAVWVGGTIVTINAQLLGGTISFFQSLCVLGYSIFPMTVAALIIGFFKIFVRTWFWLDLIITGAGCVWSLRTSAVFISMYIRPERRALALYPVLFFYTFLAWLILLF